MRKLVTAIATAATLAVLGTAPAFAHDDDYRYRGDYNGNQYQNNQYQNDQYQDNGRDYDRSREFDRGFDFNRSEGNFDRWERGWGRQGFGEFRGQSLSYWRLVRRLEAQGYYGVRNVRQARWGFGWRAFAYTGRGYPVMLRINPYTGRVLDSALHPRIKKS